MIPKVKFVMMKKEDNINIIKWALTQEDESMNLHDMALTLIPELAHTNEIDQTISNYYDNIASELDKRVIRYQSIWDKINDSYMKSLEDFLGIVWNGKESIICEVGFIPVSPRYLDECAFSISYNFDGDSLINIVSHEVLHFYWFMKFKEVLPNIKREYYDFPHLPWKYSELITEVILNHQDIYTITQVHENCCYNFDRSIIEKLNTIFNDSNLTIDKKIIKGYELIETLEENKTYGSI